MESPPYTIFLVLGSVLTVVVIGLWVLVFRADNQSLRPGKWSLVVAIPILIPLVAGLVIAAILGTTH